MLAGDLNMRIEVIIAGDGPVRGEDPDRNGPVMAAALRSLGLEPDRITLVGRDADLLDEVASRADLVLVSGDLGADLASLAAGQELRRGSARVFWLPSDPVEMEAALEARVLPAISQLRQGAWLTSRVRAFGLSRGEASRRLSGISPEERDVTVGVRQRGPELEVVVRARGSSRDEAARRAREAAAEVCARLGRAVHGPAGESLGRAAADALQARSLTVAAVEVGTGGALGATLAEDQAGAEVLLADVASESAAAVLALLGASEASSDPPDELARSLARAIRSRAGSSLGVGIHAVAGPAGGSPTEPVGLVHCALAGPTGEWLEGQRFTGMARAGIGRRAAATALRMVLDFCRAERG